MRIIFVICLLSPVFSSAYAQYTFESQPRIQYMHYKNWKLLDTTEKRSTYMILVPAFFKKQTSLKILVATYPGADSSVITIFKGKEQCQSFIDPYFIGGFSGPAPQDVFIEDVNSDGLKDIKIFYCRQCLLRCLQLLWKGDLLISENKRKLYQNCIHRSFNGI